MFPVVSHEDRHFDLIIHNINDKLTQNKINWRKHIQRMDDNRLSIQILNYKPEGRRNIGRSLTRWENDFREEGTGQGVSLIAVDDDDDDNNTSVVMATYTMPIGVILIIFPLQIFIVNHKD